MDSQPLIEEKNLKEKTIRRLIRDEFNFERRRYIFLAVNTCNLVFYILIFRFVISQTQAFTIFNLISPINIEGQRSLLFYEEVRETLDSKSVNMLTLLSALIFVHLIRLFTCILGYFSLSQKSGRLLTYFMILSTVCVLGRGIVSLLIIINYKIIEITCNEIFLEQDGENIGRTMANQFIIVMIFFVILEIVLALISLIQCSKSKEEYALATKQKERLMKNYNLCFEVAINQISE